VTEEEDPKLVFSRLCRRIKRRRTEIRVHIFRLERDDDWTLEVENQAGGCTVWTEPFATEEAALEAVMEVIEAEGIETFVVDPEKPTLH